MNKPGAYKVESFVHDTDHDTYFRVELNSPIYGQGALALLSAPTKGDDVWLDFACMGSGWCSYGRMEQTTATELFAELLLGLLRGEMALKPGTDGPWLDYNLETPA